MSSAVHTVFSCVCRSFRSVNWWASSDWSIPVVVTEVKAAITVRAIPIIPSSSGNKIRAMTIVRSSAINCPIIAEEAFQATPARTRRPNGRRTVLVAPARSAMIPAGGRSVEDSGVIGSIIQTGIQAGAGPIGKLNSANADHYRRATFGHNPAQTDAGHAFGARGYPRSGLHTGGLQSVEPP
jgi:hypothetical protein